MSRQGIRVSGVLGLVRRAAQLPPHRAVAKAARYARRQLAARRQRQGDLTNGTHLPLVTGLAWRRRLALGAEAIAPRWHPALRHVAAAHRAHRFDILGSGAQEPAYDATVIPDREGDWLADHINSSNFAISREVWALIDDTQYRPIDWQRDVRSGYRWRSDRHFTEQPIPIDTGADVKMPWELGRLHHLPQLALCALLAKHGTPGFATAAEYSREAINQLLDFLALNPPRFGVNWMCPMDIGIRVVNILVTIDLLDGAGLTPPQTVVDVVMRSVREHAEHIIAHLEWTPLGRSNHYLANLVGVLWAAAYLPSGPRTDSMFAFAVAELLAEAERQFGSDGGNYEGSTNYHRLSGELVLFGVALLAGLSDDELVRLEEAPPLHGLHGPEQRRGKFKRYASPSGEAIVPQTLLAKLHCAGALTRGATRPDGGTTQIGDTDSGRLLKLDPTGVLTDDGGDVVFTEDPLDHSAFIAGVGALFNAGPDTSIEACVVRALAKEKLFSEPAPLCVADHGDLDGIIAMIATLPEECRRHRLLNLDDSDGWKRVAFPDFGLYVFRTQRDFFAFRCAPRPSPTAPLGHTHDDNLSIEYAVSGDRRLDPGSYCYTSSLKMRDRYRSAAAHDVVRAVGWDIATMESDPFAINHEAWATCTAWRPSGVAGEVATHRGRLWRAVRVGPSHVEIWDGVSPPNRLRPISEPLPVACGYGRLETQGQAA